jgi:hypothetical protein
VNEILLVSLRGGLGNQLFQLAFLLSRRKEGRLFLEPWIFDNENAHPGQCGLWQFSLPDRVSFIERKPIFHRLWSRIDSYMLRAGSENEITIARKVNLWAIEAIGSFIASIAYRTIFRVAVASGNGYDARIDAKPRSNYFIGFFQSFNWVMKNEVNLELGSIKPKSESLELAKYIELARRVKPLVIHLRLGDYLLDENRGIPDLKYYESAINWQNSKTEFSEIWIFSDDIDLAKKKLNNLPQSSIKWFQKINNSDAETFELMRHGHAFVIGNSTFSWWAAYLSYSKNPEVVAPEPWFKSSPNPILLLPRHWKKMDPGY